MKRALLTLLLVSFMFVSNSYSKIEQSDDFFVGAWEVIILGTPYGDVKMIAQLSRTDGKLVGDLEPVMEPSPGKIPIDRIEENGDSITIYFYAEGTDVDLRLTKVDDDNLQGLVMGQMSSSAKRISK